MILGAAFCPHPPVLVPEVAVAAAKELADVRAACAVAITRLAGCGAQLVLLGSDDSSVSHSPLCRGSLAGFGLPMEVSLGTAMGGGPLDLPLSLTIGGWLAGQSLGPHSGACGFSIGPDFATSAAAAELEEMARSQDVALLVMGDGSARRSTSAPGFLDDRAAGFDEAITSALAEGDARALRDLDIGIGAELMSAGVPAWRAVGRLMDGVDVDATLLLSTAPLGVGYFVALWTARG